MANDTKKKLIETQNNSINTKVAMATVFSSVGSIISIVLNTLLENWSFLSSVSEEDMGIFKTSLTALITGSLTLMAGYYTNPGEGDGIINKEEGDKNI